MLIDAIAIATTQVAKTQWGLPLKPLPDVFDVAVVCLAE